MSRPVWDLTACVSGRSNEVLPVAHFLKSTPSPAPGTALVIFVHGYNNDRLTNEERLGPILNALRRHVRPDLESDVVSFTWPANVTSKRWVSGPSYPLKVGVAKDSGASMAAALLDLRSRGRYRVRIVAHSLGCLVALQAAADLRETDLVEDLVLLGAAVPEGLCTPGAPFAGPLARRHEHVLFSEQDEILGGNAFPAGQLVAVMLGKQAVATGTGRTAVGLSGGPAGRWAKEVIPRSVTHTGYWHDPDVVLTVAPYLGRPSERCPRNRSLASARPRVRRHSAYRMPSRHTSRGARPRHS